MLYPLVAVFDTLTRAVNALMGSQGDFEAPYVTSAEVRELNAHAANEALGTDFPDTGEFESIAGLPMGRTGRLVTEGQSVTAHGVRFTVETVEHNRVLEVRMDLADPGPAATESATEE